MDTKRKPRLSDGNIRLCSSLISLIVTTVVLVYTIVRFGKLPLPTSQDLLLISSNQSKLEHDTTSSPTKLKFPVSAHARLFPSVRYPGTENSEDPIFNPTSHSILELNEQATDNIHQHATGVNITREGIKIIIAGVYYIYSNVNFKPNSTRYSADFHYQTWFQYISRRSATSPVLSGVLLRTVHTCCSNCTGSQETAYTGGVFYLQAGDVIQISVSGQGLLDFGNEMTCLGLYLLHC
ncbi:uncharacterized protein LOC131942348 isoform X2 [Physella acuta]|uniref:uncharacterized protein LOC131942348 isoform X2 n=1 Tax=Physella acuta TaxID=109671 RepID=UPI0027DBEEA4|nr:uncharacterized protein LOC131942348 isoform X2 [Physella acuta]XP_059158154.1 uncharacterized protein LOC131942348 isoform X2 [Physella acuta]